MFVAIVAALFATAAKLFGDSAVRGVCLSLGALALIPLFFTGRVRDLPVPLAIRTRPVLQALHRRLSRDSQIDISILGRFPNGCEQPDELRLLVMPKAPLLGLNAIEVACELHPSFAGPLVEPVVLVRAGDASPSYEALPQGVVWSRGRTPHERACVIRPRVPGLANTVKLISELTTSLSAGRAVKSNERSAIARSPVGSDRLSTHKGARVPVRAPAS